MNFKLFIDNPLSYSFPIEFFESLTKKVLRKLRRVKEEYYISITLIDDEIRNYNLSYRGIDSATDVLAFATQEIKGEESKIIYRRGMPIQLGDIIIDIEQAKRQMKDNLENEVSLLFVHGLLHLFNFDHDTPEKEKVMFELQEEVLKSELEREFITKQNKKQAKKGENIFKMMFYMIKFSLMGLICAFKEEKSFRLHFICGFLLPLTAAIACFFLKVPLSFGEWAIISISSGVLLSVELLNSAIENAVDLSTTERNVLAKNAKDLGSASVITIGTITLILNLIIFINKIILLLK